MKYIFFDTELVDGRFKICEFGYVICDEVFNIIEKNNILINPKGKIELSTRTGKEIHLTYTEEEYKKHKKFCWHYNEIKELLTSKDNIILGYSVDNDVRYLFRDCGRYNVPLFNFKVYDVQKIFDKFINNDKKQIGLIKAKELLGIKDDNIVDHKADDDSLSTLEVLKKISFNLKLSLPELLELCLDCSFEVLPVYLKSNKKPKLKSKKK